MCARCLTCLILAGIAEISFVRRDGRRLRTQPKVGQTRSHSKRDVLLLVLLSLQTQLDLRIKYHRSSYCYSSWCQRLRFHFLMKTLPEALFAKNHGLLMLGSLIFWTYVLQQHNWTGLFPRAGPLVDKGRYSRFRLSRAESLQRELRWGLRGVSFGRELSKSYEVFCGEGDTCSDGYCGFSVSQMGFPSGGH